LESALILAVILLVAILGKADAVSIAVCVLLIIKILHVEQYIFPALEKSGMFWGLIILIAAILIPIANGNITTMNIKNVFTSWLGITAIIVHF